MAPKPKLTVERIQSGRPWPLDFVLTVEQNQRIGERIVQDIVGNVRGQRRVDGTRQKVNAPSTRAQKVRAGRTNPHTSSLVDDPDEHRFATKGKYGIRATKSQVVVWPKARRINRFVQRLGYVGWIGLSKKGVASIRRTILNIIRRAQKKAARYREKTKGSKA